MNTVRGLELPSQVEITLDGARVKLVTIGGSTTRYLGNVNPTASAEQLSKRVETQIPVKAGPHTVAIAFLQKSTGPTVDMLQPFGREKLDPVNTAGFRKSTSCRSPGPSSHRSRRYTQPPPDLYLPSDVGNADAVPCARKILTTLARKAYRRPVTDAETGTSADLFPARAQ